MNSIEPFDETGAEARTAPLRLGFLGAGWIGRHRMEAILSTGLAQAVAIADPSNDMLDAAAQTVPGAQLLTTLDALLAEDLDGIVIATPSAQHAEQSIRALNAGVAVFCQKPLGRNGAEARAVIDAARSADRLLAVDFSYRHTEAMRRIRELLQSQQLGKIMAIDLTFHNAYGPDKPWFYEKTKSGGGCVMDLGVHLIDLALWALDFPNVVSVSSRLLARGELIQQAHGEVEDFAVATLELDHGTIVRLACSWRLNAGRDCIIDASFYGTNGGAAMRNVGGSFFDFIAERFSATSAERLIDPPDAWGGRAAVAWTHKLRQDACFDKSCERLLDVAETIDRIYEAARVGSASAGGK